MPLPNGRSIFNQAGIFALLAMSATAQTTIAPRIFYSDIDSGPAIGGQNNAGAFVTIYGLGFGATQGSSSVTVGGNPVSSYPFWTDSKVSVQLGSAAATGNIVITTANGASNGIPFTVRAGNIYFVAVSGNDGANGSYGTPWQSMLHARDTIAPGDIVYVRDGVTQSIDDGEGWSACITIGYTAGTAGNPMAMVVYPGESATIGSTTACANGIRNKGYNENYWTFAGFKIAAVDSAFAISQGTHWRIVGNDITCPNGDGPTACVETGNSGNLAVYGNNVHDTGAATASALYQGVYFSTDTNHVDFGWNTIARAHGCRGLQINSTPLGPGGAADPSGHNQYDLHIHDNIIHDTQCDGMVLYTIDPSQGPVEVYNNLIYNAGMGPNNPDQTGAWSCIYIAAESNNGPPGSGTAEVYNNTMYNCGSFANPPYIGTNAGVLFAGPDPDQKLRLRNNIIYMTTGYPYVLGYDANAEGGSPPCTSCSRISGSNNILFGLGTPGTSGVLTGTLNVDPQFVNLGALNFSIQSGSPAATGGTATTLTSDINGIPYSGGYPIGAYAVPSNAPAPISISISPTQTALGGGGSIAFSATVTGSTNQAVTWTFTPAVGSLDDTGFYTAPLTVTATQIITVTATSVADPTQSASASITLTPPPPIVYSISGNVFNSDGVTPLPGVAMILFGQSSTLLLAMTDQNGFYEFDGLTSGGSYVVAPILVGYQFAQPSVEIDGPDAGNNPINFTGTPVAGSTPVSASPQASSKFRNKGAR